MSNSNIDNYTVDVKEKVSDWFEVIITKPFWVGSALWEPGHSVCTFIPPLEREGFVLVYDQELGTTVRIPLTHCKYRKFEYVVRTTVETFWNHWEEDGILPEEEDWFKEVIDFQEMLWARADERDMLALDYILNDTEETLREVRDGNR